MWCMKCKNELYDCKCPDIKERLAGIKGMATVTSAWCKGCDNHHSQCKCEEPEWTLTTGDNK